MITCSTCYKSYHKSCTKCSGDKYICLSCSRRSNARSINSHSSSKSDTPLSRTLQLQLQRLEEELTLNHEYINKKYQLLEAAKNIDGSVSHKSDSLCNEAVANMPNVWLVSTTQLQVPVGNNNSSDLYNNNIGTNATNIVVISSASFEPAYTTVVPNCITLTASNFWLHRMQSNVHKEHSTIIPQSVTNPNCATYAGLAVLIMLNEITQHVLIKSQFLLIMHLFLHTK